jgi:hypothetical protein
MAGIGRIEEQIVQPREQRVDLFDHQHCFGSDEQAGGFVTIWRVAQGCLYLHDRCDEQRRIDRSAAGSARLSRKPKKGCSIELACSLDARRRIRSSSMPMEISGIAAAVEISAREGHG